MNEAVRVSHELERESKLRSQSEICNDIKEENITMNGQRRAIVTFVYNKNWLYYWLCKSLAFGVQSQDTGLKVVNGAVSKLRLLALTEGAGGVVVLTDAIKSERKFSSSPSNYGPIIIW